jgi:hypothetical protein
MSFLSNLARQILVQVVKPELERIAADIKAAGVEAHKAHNTAQASLSQVRDLKRQMSAALAIDIGIKEFGKVIILTRINGQDRVKIVDTKPQMTIPEYKRLVESLEREYGATTTWIDGPPGAREILTG